MSGPAGRPAQGAGEPPRGNGAGRMTAGEPRSGRTRYLAIGCLMMVAGLFSGAMVSVLVARFVSWGTHCRYDAELPACNWPEFAAVGGLIGAVTLPALVLWQILRPRRQIGAEPQNQDL
jgi:hypothetical protein